MTVERYMKEQCRHCGVPLPEESAGEALYCSGDCEQEARETKNLERARDLFFGRARWGND